MRSTPPASLETTLEDILDAVPKTVHLLNPSPALLRPFIYHAYTRETLPTTRVFATQNLFNTVFTDFKTSTKAAELTANHSIAFRIAAFDTSPAIIYDNTTLALIHHYLLEDTNQQLASDIHEMLSNEWDNTTEYTFTTPPLSTIYESITNTFGSTVLLDIKTIFDAADTTALTPPTLALLIAIRHNHTFADITTWAESLQLTTRGTLYRHRKTLEDAKLLETTPAETTTNGRPPLKITPLTTDLTDDPSTALETIAEHTLTYE